MARMHSNLLLMYSIAGFGTHFVPSSRLPMMMDRLADLESDNLVDISMVLDEFSGDMSFYFRYYFNR